MQSSDGRSWWSRKREPCWGDGCARPAAAEHNPRWRGHYCQACQHRLADDAARIEEEEQTNDAE